MPSESRLDMSTTVRDAHRVVYQDILASLHQTAARHKHLPADELIAILATTVGYLISSMGEEALAILRSLALENLDNGILYGADHMSQVHAPIEKRAADVSPHKTRVPRRLQRVTH